MTKILILGNSSSGKSTLAKRLAAAEDLPALDLDTVAWARHAVRASLDTSLAQLRAFAEAHPEGWIMEGCYGALIEAAAPWSTQLYFLDPGVEVCLARSRARPWEPHKYDSRAAQDAALSFLQQWIRDYYTREDECSRAYHQRVYAAYLGSKQRVDAPA